MDEIFYDIFSDLPRQGPGDDISTKKAIDLLNELSSNPIILDLGCGTGTQTIQLAKQLGGKIFAIDNHQAYLTVLKEKADSLGYGNIIFPIKSDMGKLDFQAESFDLIWAEGSIYIMGFENGLKYVKKFLKPGGYIAVTELCWFKNDRPAELDNFFMLEYPAMNNISENIDKVRSAGYQLIDYFTLSPSAWLDNFYLPLESRLNKMRKKYHNNEQAKELIHAVETEIELYRKYPDYYGYAFYIMRKQR